MTSAPSIISTRARNGGLALFLAGLILSSSLQAAGEELLHANDFSEDTVGEKPESFDHLRPIGPNVGTEDPFPIPWQIEDGPVGALVVGESSTPARSLPGDGNQSFRIYDYTSQGSDSQAYAGKNFVVNAVNNRYDVRLDLRFQRSTFIERELSGDRLLIALGGFASDRSLHQNANRAITVSLTNEGEWQAHGEPPEGVEGPVGGLYEGDGVNDLKLVANAHPTDELTYDGPQGAHTLAPFTYSLYLNEVRVADAMGFNVEAQLGKFAFVTGFGTTDAEIDFLIDDIEVTGLREMEEVEFELDLAIDFEDQTAGEQPEGFTRVDPESNIGESAEFPISSNDQGPVGTVVVDEESSPVPSINGNSVRLYEYNGADRSKLSRLFIPEGEAPVPHIRFDFTFRRSVAIAEEDGNPGQGLLVALGEPDSGLTLHQGAGRAMEIRILNDGRFRSVGESFSSNTQIEPFDEIGTHEVSVFANVHDEAIDYEGPDGEEHTLEGRHFTVFLNGEVFDENNGLRHDFPSLGKFAFVTGQGNWTTDIDFVVDDIRVTNFGTAPEPPAHRGLQIARGDFADSAILSWQSEAGTTYGLEFSTNLMDWTRLEDTFTGDGSLIEHTVTIDDDDRAFYRVVSPVDAIEPGTEATFTTSHQVRLWTTNDEDPDLVGTFAYNTFQTSQIGKAGPGDQQRALNSIHGFELPVLDHELTEATYTITKTGHNGQPDDWSAQIYLFEPGITPESEDAEAVFWSDPGEDTRGLVRLIDLEAFDIDSPDTALGFTLTGTDLAGFYNGDGTPATADGMIWFRINPGQAPDDISNFERLEIRSQTDHPDSPSLRFAEPQ